MKHGISPTTDRKDIYGRMTHISKPLVQVCTDMRPEEERQDAFVAVISNLELPLSDRLKFMATLMDSSRERVINLTDQPQPYELTRLAIYGGKGCTVKAPYKEGFAGLKRRYRNSGRTLSQMAIAIRQEKIRAQA